MQSDDSYTGQASRPRENAFAVSRRVLVPRTSGETPGSVQDRRSERGDELDRFAAPSENAPAADGEGSTMTPHHSASFFLC